MGASKQMLGVHRTQAGCILGGGIYELQHKQNNKIQYS